VTAEQFGVISGVFVFGSCLPYFFGVCKRSIQPHPVSWILWAFIGLTLLLTYKTAGAKDSIIATVFGVVNPVLIVGLIFYFRFKDRRSITQKPLFESLARFEKICLGLGVIALALWILVQEDHQISSISYMKDVPLYFSILADACAGFFTVRLVLKDGSQDVPFAWGLFAIGWLINLGAITDHTFANYALPVYMIVMSGSIAVITGMYRIKTRAPILQWIF
jgi:membrane-bound acyltransferase YfiQ involved in biofilm formation